mmetsp:Transcript_4636/g.5237  ORF Transcript_4636/g.5237 Transcript_4636/m.5237 type:complete len:224 (-) Transcript_4636:1422-2093(-)|eukprot:CAMPEP_0115036976 /NCGR_PEP_ID=MMETSP0216-20121206/42485_1 /TAXON_ID=223996 /ORGANISM="Protocruzia adherens, Strain Boccale" /LENGTH=223 /DNA_ID=CAMNT_0002416991 /DNA_START=91 /DNA_END=762 /DNA_ORIENTATION=-
MQGRKKSNQEEEKKSIPSGSSAGRGRGFTKKPSTKYTSIKTASPFATKKTHKTNFGYVYSAGGVPARVNHGSVVNRIQWTQPPSSLGFDPLLVTCFEGLMETEHPFNFVAAEAAKELMMSDGAFDKCTPILSRLVPPLRLALSSRDKTIILNALELLRILSETVGEELTGSVNPLLAPIGKKMTEKAYRDKAVETLNTVEEQGGPDALAIIKTKIPTYSSIYS